uniref:RT_RNaseH_2 domain-containing protein n=1 Tax=Strongyloides venezuelensis TaxID=75913 RepID=A0A0K0FI08_STRVS
MFDDRIYPTLIDYGDDVTVIKHSIARKTRFVASNIDTMKFKLTNGENEERLIHITRNKDLQNPCYSIIIGSEVIHASVMIIDYKNLSLFVCDRPLKHLSVTKNEPEMNNVVASMSIDDNLQYFLSSYQVPIVEEQISQWLNSGTSKEDFCVKYLQNLVYTRNKGSICSPYFGFAALNGKTYKFTCLIYGLKPASSIVQRLINKTTRKFENVVAYIDDLIVTTRGSFSQHIQDVPMKEYCDIDTHSKMHRFVEKVNYIRYFIPRLAELQKPHDKMIACLKSQFKYTLEGQNAFKKIIDLIIESTKLQLSDTSRSFTLVTDASHYCYAGILLQESSQHNNILMPIFYFSKRSLAKKKKVPALYI